MLYYSNGSKNHVLTTDDIDAAIRAVFKQLPGRKSILVLPPDHTRLHSMAGLITCRLRDFCKTAVKAIMPALGTHKAMTPAEISGMFPGIPANLFKTHNWRNGITRVGVVPAGYIREISGGAVSFDWPAEISAELLNPDYDLIVSIGQVVPHEVAGMANFTKNIFVGAGGAEGINKSHFLGAAYGMEKLLGKAANPVRTLFDYAAEKFTHRLPLLYMLTVIGPDEQGRGVLRGLYIGDDAECYNRAALLSAAINIFALEKPLTKVVVYLDPGEYRSTWLGNKAVYRSRLALADGAELIILAPGVREFGEDPQVDRLIRKYGYIGTPRILDAVAADPELQANLGTAAHLIHGSTEGRFNVTYCTGGLGRKEIEAANYRYADPAVMLAQYDPARLSAGYNLLPGGEAIYYISNPATGLWEYNKHKK